MPYTQDNRLISLNVPSLGKDALLLSGFSGQEAISRLFSFQLDLLREVADPVSLQPVKTLKFSDVIGQKATISVQRAGGTPRYFNGIVSRFAQSGADDKFVHYQMEVVPALWLLTRYSDCRIFHSETVTDIIQSVLQDHGIAFSTSLSGSYSPLEYCVQYRETDFNFISRLMEKFGIFYFFQHTDTAHTMVLADSASAHQPCDGQAEAGYKVSSSLDADSVVHSWCMEQELKSGKYSLADFYFETPDASIQASEETVDSVAGNSSYELFDYPGEYTVRGDGAALAKVRMQEVEASHLLAHGLSTCRSFTSGDKFGLTDHPDDSLNASYVLTEIQHVASVAGSYAGEGEVNPEHESYSNQFICIPDTVPFRPARLTPKPFVQGPQTAIVVAPGSSSSEILVDKYGRVKVLFPWDGVSSTHKTQQYSCWLRVSQEWAGQGWGSITIPRVGQEVIVSFLEGDPDRPIITGRVYNASQTVPYALPDNQTRSTFMTRSSKGGSASTYNELRFEDKKGAEQVFLRAQFDQDNRVLNDSREWVGNNRSLMVTKDQMESVGGDLHTQVTGGVFGTVGKDVNTKVTGKVIENVGGDSNSNVAGNVIEKVGGDSNSNITGNLNQKVGQTMSLQVGQNLYEKSGQNYAHQAGMQIHLKAGMTVVLEAGTEICLKVGGNYIDINPAGVSIFGTMVMINSGGSAGSGCGSSPTDPTSPADPVAPTKPDQADDGSTGTKYGSGSAPASSTPASAGSSNVAGSSSQSAGGSSLPVPSFASGAAGAVAGAASAADDAAQAATQAAEQAAKQAASEAQGAAAAAQQYANEAEKAAQQAEQQAQQAVEQAKAQAMEAYQAAKTAASQAEAAAQKAVGQAKAAAEQAAAQAQQELQQAKDAAKQAVQQAQQEAQQVEQQAQQAAAQAKAQAQQAAQQAQQAISQAQQAVKQAEQQAQQATQQAAQQAQQAEQQAQQAAAQAKTQMMNAASQAQSAANSVKQAASQAQQEAQTAAQNAQQSMAKAAASSMPGNVF